MATVNAGNIAGGDNSDAGAPTVGSVAGGCVLPITRRDGWVLAAIGALLLGLLVFFLLVSPRPYTLFECDTESSYFFTSQVWADGFVGPGEFHPGVFARYTYLLLFRLFGRSTGEPLQHALNISYVLVAVLYFIAAGLAYLVLRRVESRGASLCAVLAALTAPTSLLFLNNFGGDSFVLVFALPLFAWSWVVFRGGHDPTGTEMLGLGVLAGLSMAAKLVVVPAVLAVGAGGSVACFAGCRTPGRSFPDLLRRLLRAGVFWVAAPASHLIACLPLHVALLTVWKRTLGRWRCKAGLEPPGVGVRSG